jgi:hypothetical protein
VVSVNLVSLIVHSVGWLKNISVSEARNRQW